ncbi:hypothetical protein LINGRAHAP2_LOCUS3346 [Linum grandiflorum]
MLLLNWTLHVLFLVSWVLRTPSEDQRHSTCIQQIQKLLNRDWVVHVTHIYREGNRVADLLAHFGHSLPPRLYLIDAFCSNIVDCIHADIRGVVFSWFIND